MVAALGSTYSWGQLALIFAISALVCFCLAFAAGGGRR